MHQPGFRTSEQVRGSRPAAERAWHLESRVDLFERAEEPHEGVLQLARAAAARAEIGVPELAGLGDGGSAHRPVFVSALRPDDAGAAIEPDSETHA